MNFFLERSGISKIINFRFNTKQRQTFLLHLIYSIIEGIILGFLALNEFVLIKGLGGNDYQISLLFQFSVIVLLFSVLFNELLKRALNKKKLLRIVAILTRLPLFLLIFFPVSPENQNSYSFQIFFLLIFFIFYLANPIVMPAINIFLKKNYTHENFSKLYSYATAVHKIVMLFATFGFGLLLDYKPHSYVYVYPFTAILGIVSIFILTKIDYEQPEHQKSEKSLFKSLKDSTKNIITIVAKNKPFRDFEIGFMLYGFAWMLAVAVIAIFLSKQLELNYTSLAFYKNSYNTISIIITPYLGKMLGKTDPRKFSIYTFIFMIFYLAFMGLTEFFPAKSEILGITIYYSLIVSYISYGIFGGLMGLLWYIGSAYFCDDKSAGDYQAVHLYYAGLRGALIPMAGIYLYGFIGYSGIFTLGILFLLAAIFVNIKSIKNKNLERNQNTIFSPVTAEQVNNAATETPKNP